MNASGLGLLLLLGCSAWAQGIVYPHRWVYVSRGLQNDKDVEDIREIARVSFEHGLTGMVLAAGLDRLDLQSPSYVRRLLEVKGILDQYSMELIPEIFSVGYGGSVISHNRNLAEGLPVKDSLFVARDGVASLEADPPVLLINGGFEDYSGDRMTGYSFHDRPGEVSFTDTQVFHSGAASLRFESFQNFPAGNARVMQEILVKPYRCYRVTAWVKTQDLDGSLRVQVLATDSRAMAPLEFDVPKTGDWRKLTVGVNSTKEERIRIYVGVWGGRGGKFWVDDLAIEEIGLTNVLRRPGTPILVRSDDRDMIFEEGVDYAPIRDPTLTFRFDHEGPRIVLTASSRIVDGEHLRVSYYHGVSVNGGQVSVCMSEPELYDIWTTQARLIQQYLAPRKYFLSMDEIRAGGSDLACKRREMSMAQILGDCIWRQYSILKDVSPEAEIAIWSDMLDPNHNAHGNYYLVEGDYTGSWEYIPRDLIITCWYYQKRRESLGHFSGLGFRTAAGAYYDGDTLDNPKGWLDALDLTQGAVGIMYTTWENKYGLLAAFGDLVSKRE